jgi:Arc/MetJ family transcription regulator
MRINIVLDDELIQEAFKYSNVKTKNELITLALKEFVSNHGRLDLRDIQGKIAFREDYDYKKLRKAKKT